jgi:hypothetical protein
MFYSTKVAELGRVSEETKGFKGSPLENGGTQNQP